MNFDIFFHIKLTKMFSLQSEIKMKIIQTILF